MNIKQLETLIWTCRLGSVRQAAIQLGTSQPAASARIRELEEQLGLSLFDRDTRPIRISPQGREILRLAEKIVDLSAAMQEHASRIQPIYGSIRLGANHAVASSWLPRLLKSLYAQLPGVEVELVVELSDNLMDMMRRVELDVAFVAGRFEDKAIGYSQLYELSLEWVASKRCEGLPDVVTPQRIARFPVLTDSVGSPVHQAVQNWFRAANVQPRRIDICSGPPNRLNLAADGEWITVMPSQVLATYVRAGEFRVLPSSPPLEPMRMGVAYRLAADVGPTLQLVLNIAREVVDLWHATGRTIPFS